jgi:hypothetical protein
MSHPPIPLNCPYFKYEPDGKYFFNQQPQWVFGIPSKGESEVFFTWWVFVDHLRPLIAAVARCAWLDQASRIEGLNTSATMSFYDGMVATESRDIAIENAEAWRIWGVPPHLQIHEFPN